MPKGIIKIETEVNKGQGLLGTIRKGDFWASTSIFMLNLYKLSTIKKI